MLWHLDLHSELWLSSSSSSQEPTCPSLDTSKARLDEVGAHGVVGDVLPRAGDWNWRILTSLPSQTMIPWQGGNMAPGLHVCIYHSHPENVSPSTTAIYQYQLLNKLSRALCPGFQLQLTGQTSFWFLNPWKKWAAAHPQKKMASSSWKNFKKNDKKKIQFLKVSPWRLLDF